MVDIEECEMVSVNVSKSHLRFVCLLFGFSGTNKDLGNCEREGGERERERKIREEYPM